MSYVPPPSIQRNAKSSKSVWLIVLFVGAAACFVLIVGAAVLYPVFAEANKRAKVATTVSTFHEGAYALLIYASAHDYRMPPHLSTIEDFSQATGGITHPGFYLKTSNPAGGLALPNPNLEGVDLNLIAEPERVAVIYETRDWGDGGRVTAFLDGQTKMVVPFDPATGLEVKLNPAP